VRASKGTLKSRFALRAFVRPGDKLSLLTPILKEFGDGLSTRFAASAMPVRRASKVLGDDYR